MKLTNNKYHCDEIDICKQIMTYKSMKLINKIKGNLYKNKIVLTLSTRVTDNYVIPTTVVILNKTDRLVLFKDPINTFIRTL